ncbi:MAG: PD40 domain-containing protein [Bacteroidetes bacterium]|nr:PD40 domain-containing protein [Bacteroidota bacterium]
MEATIYIYDLEQSLFISIPFTLDNYEHVWSPDGSKIAFVARETSRLGETHLEKITNSDIWIVDSDGNGLTNLTTTGQGYFESSPIWIDYQTMIIEQKLNNEETKNVVLTISQKQ